MADIIRKSDIPTPNKFSHHSVLNGITELTKDNALKISKIEWPNSHSLRGNAFNRAKTLGFKISVTTDSDYYYITRIYTK